MDFSFKLLIISFAVISIWCTKNKYTIINEYAKLSYYNKPFVDELDIHPFKFNRITFLLNMSFHLHVDIKSDVDSQILITGFQFRSNEYRKGPVEFMIPTCTGLRSKPDDIRTVVEHSNLHPWPLLKENNHLINFQSNATNYPPLIPEGRWMLQTDFLYRMKTVATLQWFARIEYQDGYSGN